MIAVIDIEASGLVDSYPIEIGWAIEDGKVGAVLIRPPDEWVKHLHWDPQAVAIHKLKREVLDTHGISPATALKKMNADLRECRCYSDLPEYDWRWIQRLMLAGGFRIDDLTFALAGESADAMIAGLILRDLMRVADRVPLIEMLDATQRHRPHSAAGDAARWMAALELGRTGIVAKVSINRAIEKWDARAVASAAWRQENV